MHDPELDAWHMGRALELAARGEGLVEPNPMVGCTIVAAGETVGEGWHRQFGGPHAEVEALRLAGARARGATAYVTLEPCCHQGKTPPCTQALIRAGIARVVVAIEDPFPQVAGKGIAELRAAGVAVDLGQSAAASRYLSAPYLKLARTGRPWAIAKWAMTLDGKLATHTGDSRWISCEESRAVVHRLRGRVDGILVGRGTAAADDPLLTARPGGVRTATRIVLDTNASLSLDSQLVKTAREVPVIVAVAADSALRQRAALAEAGCEVLELSKTTSQARLEALLMELGRRRMTNLLVEGGSTLLGSLFDLNAVDEVHAFIAPMIAGGASAPTAVGGNGVRLMSEAVRLADTVIEPCGADAYVRGRLSSP